jgi:hypothetical protein
VNSSESDPSIILKLKYPEGQRGCLLIKPASFFVPFSLRNPASIITIISSFHSLEILDAQENAHCFQTDRRQCRSADMIHLDGDDDFDCL